MGEPHAFALTEDQLGLVEDARRLAHDVLAPIAAAGDPGRVNRPLVAALAEHRLLPRLFPDHVGGLATREVSALELCLLREGLAQGSTEAETALAMQGLGGHTILRSGREDVVRRWVPRVARGDAVAAFALTEPEHGTDAGAIETRAEPDGSGYRLSGVKTWISNAPDADVYVLFARTTPDVGAKGVTAFVVPGDSTGLSGEQLELLSPHPIGRLQLDGVHVPAGHVLGEVDAGFRVAMATLDLFRPSVGAFAVGMAQWALDLSVTHAGSRTSMGRALREHQAVSQMLGEMAARVEAARLLVYASASAYDSVVAGGAPPAPAHGALASPTRPPAAPSQAPIASPTRAPAAPSRPPTLSQTRLSAMAKLVATQTAQFVVDAAVQIHGAAGLERGHPIEHLYREVRAPRIYEGTSEIQREIIARELYR